MYGRKARSVESLISITDPLLSVEPVIVAEPAARTMDSPTKSDVEAGVPGPQESIVHSEFFSQLVYFKVGTTLYNVSSTLLSGCGYLASAIGREDMINGTSMFDPIHLNITVSEMNSMMYVLHARQTSGPLNLTIQQWSEALHIATIWNIISAREYIINRILISFPDQPPIDRIVLADRCGAKRLLYPAYEELCIRSNPPTTEEGIEKLGVDRIVAIFTIREALRASAPSTPIDDSIPCERQKRMPSVKQIKSPVPKAPISAISADNVARMIEANRVLSLNLMKEEPCEAPWGRAEDYGCDPSTIISEVEPVQCEVTIPERQPPAPCRDPRPSSPSPTRRIWISQRALSSDHVEGVKVPSPAPVSAILPSRVLAALSIPEDTVSVVQEECVPIPVKTPNPTISRRRF
ncbi:hypothetical protein FRB95_008102 [Tulasnella sp. JGI-2019a]|nr:hypothetical protein FRB95_008102 [Tulasnella sp. JGI-2019a]